MAQLFQALGTVFSNPAGGLNLGNIAKVGLTGAGLLGNIIAQQKQNSALNRIAYYQKNPAAASQVIRSLTQPLSASLTQDVGNQVQGYLGERGLSQSPNITAEVLSQALAPYVQQNQSTAIGEFNSLLNPAGAGYTQPSSLAPLLALWQKPQTLQPLATPASYPPTPTGGGGTPPFIDPSLLEVDPLGGLTPDGGVNA